MDHNLIAKNYIQIDASPPEKVWDVLTNPKIILCKVFQMQPILMKLM